MYWQRLGFMASLIWLAIFATVLLYLFFAD